MGKSPQKSPLAKHLSKLFVLSLALFSLSFSCSPEDVVKKVVENSIKSIGDTENASQTPPDTSGPTCDLNNITDDCYDLLAGWYGSPDGAYFIYFSGKDAKEMVTFPPCDWDNSFYNLPYTLGANGEIGPWSYGGYSYTAHWDGADTLTVVTKVSYQAGTYTRRADLAKATNSSQTVCTP